MKGGIWKTIGGKRVFSKNGQNLCDALKDTHKFAKYKDVTQEWIKTATPNSHEIVKQSFVEVDGIKYKVDGRKVVFEASEKEIEVANWLKQNFGGEIFLLPRVNFPQGVKTADYIFKKEKWDLKEITGKSNQLFFSAISKKEKQSHNFVFDVTRSPLSSSDIKKQIGIVYRSKELTWLDKVIVKKNTEIKGIYKKNEKSWYPRPQ